MSVHSWDGSKKRSHDCERGTHECVRHFNFSCACDRSVTGRIIRSTGGAAEF